MESIELKEVSKFYSTGSSANKGLDGVSIKFNRGEFVAITGESGSGKTTLLNVVSTLMEVDQGDLLIDGKDTYEWSEDKKLDFRRNNIGFVFQEYNIIPGISALDNVLLALHNIGYDKKEAKDKAIKALNDVGLHNEINKKVAILSGGERQRVVIARALASDCSFLAIDEPTGNLDSKTGKEIIRLIKDFAKNRLVLYVTHDYDSIKDIATRHVELKDGKVIKDELLRNPDVVTPLKDNERKPVNVFLSSLKILFSSTGRFALLTLSLILFAFASMGIAFGMNSIEEGGVFSLYVPTDYYSNPDPNSLLILPKDGDSINTEELSNDDNVVDEGDITSIAMLRFNGLSEEMNKINNELSINNDFKLLTFKDSSSYEEAYKNSSVIDGMDLYIDYGATPTTIPRKKIKEGLNSFFASSPKASIFFDQSMKPMNNDQLNGVKEFIDLNDFLGNFKVRSIFYKRGDVATGESFFKPTSSKAYREFIQKYSSAYMKGFSTDYNSDYPIGMLTGVDDYNLDHQLQFIFDGKPLKILRGSSSDGSAPFVFPSDLQPQRDKLKIRLYKKEISFDDYLNTVNTKFNKQYTSDIYTYKEGNGKTPEESLMSFSDENPDTVIINGFASVLHLQSFDSSFNALSVIFQSKIRVYNLDAKKVESLHSDLKNKGISSEILSKKTTLTQYQELMNNIYLAIKIIIYIVFILVYCFTAMITGKIEKNLTKNFAKDDYVLITLGFSNKSRLFTKIVILSVPTLITTALTLLVIAIVISFTSTIAILPYIFIYLIFLIFNLLFSGLMAYRWQKRVGGF